MAKYWYVVHVYSGYEKSVRAILLERIASTSMGDLFGDIMVPVEEVTEIRLGKKRNSERKFFPGYVLVEMEMNDDTWHVVRNVPRVLGFIGGKGDKPVPISEKEARVIFNNVEASVEKPKPKVLFEPGELVRINDGPFNDFNGVIEEVDYEKSHLQVSVTIFGRTTPVTLEFDQVEKG